MTYVFISYRRKDSAFALYIAEKLLQAKYLIWFDQFEINGGNDWILKLQEGVNNCSVLACILSPDYINSKYCRRELNRADSLGKHIIPLLYKPVSPDIWPIELQEKQYIDFTSDVAWVTNEGTHKLLQDVGNILNSSGTQSLTEVIYNQPTIKIIEDEIETLNGILDDCISTSSDFVRLQMNRLQERLKLHQRSWELANDQLDELLDLSQIPQLEKKIERLSNEIVSLKKQIASLCK